MKEIVNEYKEYLLNSHKSENTVYAYVTDVNLYIKYLNTKDIYLDETDNLTVLGYIQYLLQLLVYLQLEGCFILICFYASILIIFATKRPPPVPIT